MPMVVYTEEEMIEACNQAVAVEARQIAETRDKFMALLAEAKAFVRDAGSDEDPEANRNATDLLARIEALGI